MITADGGSDLLLTVESALDFNELDTALEVGMKYLQFFNVVVSLPPEQLNEHRARLTEMGFIPAGSVQVPKTMKYNLLWKKMIRRSGDGGPCALRAGAIIVTQRPEAHE